MISQLSPAMARVAVQARPEDLFLQKGSWVKFSPKWGAQGDARWAAGNLFEVTNEPVVVQFPLPYTIPGGDYVDVNLANLPTGFSKTQLNLYPNTPGVLYQAGIGLEKDDFFIQLGIPSATKYVYNLGMAFMYPSITDANLKYLGQKTWRDSPARTPLWFLYFIYNLPYIYFRIYALAGKDFEKCRIVFWINKCGLSQVTAPGTAVAPGALAAPDAARYQDMQRKALYLPWYEELTQY